MATINKRTTAKIEGDFVVFLIGMRINKFYKINKWFPVVMAMPKMLNELYQNPDSGFLGAQSWFGKTTIMVQYWKSFEHLTVYARNPEKNHYPAWVAFNKKIKGTGDVGVWHETYKIQGGNYECIYSNMPLFGLAKASLSIDVNAHNDSASQRIEHT
ncbi:MAG: DUF4188 domain-containing protein [Fimbriimonadaceae bacterium]|nr:DUF4188 domain-containing protein [Chitinophagales bacterium]